MKRQTFQERMLLKQILNYLQLTIRTKNEETLNITKINNVFFFTKKCYVNTGINIQYTFFFSPSSVTPYDTLH